MPYHLTLTSSGKLRAGLHGQVALTPWLARLLRLVQDALPEELVLEKPRRTALQSLLDSPDVNIHPVAEIEIRQALDQVAQLTAPLMPPTDFELIAYGRRGGSPGSGPECRLHHAGRRPDPLHPRHTLSPANRRLYLQAGLHS